MKMKNVCVTFYGNPSNSYEMFHWKPKNVNVLLAVKKKSGVQDLSSGEHEFMYKTLWNPIK